MEMKYAGIIRLFIMFLFSWKMLISSISESMGFCLAY